MDCSCYKYTAKMTRDAKRGRPARDTYWSNLPPTTRRRPPGDIMRKKEELSPKAKAAKKIVDLWSLFITPEMMAKIVRYTNDKIQETMYKRKYTQEDLKKKPHIRYVDLVSFSVFLFLHKTSVVEP